MTSERFTTKENEQILKEVKPQEEKLLVQTPRSDDLVAGNRLRERLQNFETLEKNPIYKSLRRCVILEKESLWECATKPLQTWMMVLEIELQHAESMHTLVLSQIPEFLSRFQNEP